MFVFKHQSIKSETKKGVQNIALAHLQSNKYFQNTLFLHKCVFKHVLLFYKGLFFIYSLYLIMQLFIFIPPSTGTIIISTKVFDKVFDDSQCGL